MSRITDAMDRRDGEDSGNQGSPDIHPVPWPIDNVSTEDPAEGGWGSRRPTINVPRAATSSPDNDLLRYTDVIRRQWRIGAIVAVIVTVGISAGALLQKPTFRASGLLEIRQDNSAQAQSLLGSDRVATNELETQYGILRSSSLAARVAAQLSEKVEKPEKDDKAEKDRKDDKDPKAATGDKAADKDEDAFARRGRVITAETIQRGLRVTPKTGSRLVEVSYVSTSAATARAVVNGVLDNYLQLRMEEARRSAEWLGRQLKEARGRLEDSESRLHTFLRSHALDVMETGKGETAQVVNERIQTLHKQLADAQADRISRQSEAERARLQASRGDFDSPVIQSLTIKLGELRREEARLAAVFHADYPSVQAITTQIAETERLIERESARVGERAQRDYQAAERREALIRQAIDQQDAMVRRLSDGDSDTGSYEAMKREVVTNQAQFAALDQRLKDVSISAALRAANVGIVDRASIAPGASGSSAPAVIGLAAVIGLLLGGGAIFLKNQLDTSVRSSQDVDDYLGLPTFAAIPGLSPQAVRAAEPQGALAEAFAALRTAVLLRDDAAAARVLLVTSASVGEGKTTVSANLATSLARLNHRVLVIDANLRSPALHTVLALNRERSLVDVLEGVDWRSCVQSAVQKNLDVISGGRPSISPADLLSLPQMRQLLTVVSCEYDFVVMDAPAVLEHPADVHALARFAGRVLLTIRQGVTSRKEIQAALSQIDHVSGVVLNGFSPREPLTPRRATTSPAPPPA